MNTGHAKQVEFENIQFSKALTFCIKDNVLIGKFDDEEFARKKISGLYVVLENDLPVYIGSYQNGFRVRWLKKDYSIYHFKKTLIGESICSGSDVIVYAQEESIAKAQIV